jgi:hypothetical protein
MKRKQCLVFIMTFVAAAWLQALAVTTEVEVNVEPKISSAFVWRGQVLNDESCFQPTLAFLGTDFSITAWGNWDLTTVSNATRNTRVDATLDYTTSAASQLLSVGLVSYIYRDSPSVGPDDTFEVYVRDAVDIVLLPTLTVFYDFSAIKGFYGNFSLAHSFQLVEDTLYLECKTVLGAADGDYNEAAFGYLEDPADPEDFQADKAALVDLTVSLSLPYWRTDKLVLTPTVKYTSLMDSQIRDAVDRSGQDTDLFYYSFSVAYIF